MTLLIQKIVRDWLESEEEANRRKTTSKNLWPSDIGYCPRKAILRVDGNTKTVAIKTKSLNYMRTGVVMEDETSAALHDILGDRVESQLRLEMQPWSGRPDFVIDHGTESPILVEHKVTGEKAWWQDDIIPRLPHIGQLAIYGRMYEHMFGTIPTLMLYYRGWGHYAEFTIKLWDGNIYVTGYVDDIPTVKTIGHDIWGDIKALELYYKQYEETGELPPRLKAKSHGCTFMGQPDCTYYYHCYEK